MDELAEDLDSAKRRLSTTAAQRDRLASHLLALSSQQAQAQHDEAVARDSVQAHMRAVAETSDTLDRSLHALVEGSGELLGTLLQQREEARVSDADVLQPFRLDAHGKAQRWPGAATAVAPAGGGRHLRTLSDGGDTGGGLEPQLLSHMDLNEYLQQDSAFTRALNGYFHKQFQHVMGSLDDHALGGGGGAVGGAGGGGGVGLGGARPRSALESLGLKAKSHWEWLGEAAPESLLLHGDTAAAHSRYCSELARLQLVYGESERAKLGAELALAAAKAQLEEASSQMVRHSQYHMLAPRVLKWVGSPALALPVARCSARQLGAPLHNNAHCL